MFVLFNAIFGWGLNLVGSLLVDSLGFVATLPALVYSLGVLIPSLAVGVRRLHDINKSGWWFLIPLIPIVGSIWLIVLFCKEGDKGDNKYGPDPKALEE